jgi:hypothetical protein
MTRTLLSLCTLLVCLHCAPKTVTLDCAQNPESCPLQTLSAPKLYVDPPFGASFECVLLGCKETRILTLENKGTQALILTLIRLSAHSSTDFTLALEDQKKPIQPPQRENPLTLLPQTSVQALIQYTPSDGNIDQGWLWIEWINPTDPQNPNAITRTEMPLRTRSLGEARSDASTEPLTFGYVPVGESRVLNAAISNTSPHDAILTVRTVHWLPDSDPAFSVGLGWDPDANPGEKIDVPIVLSPTRVGVFYGMLKVYLNDTRTPERVFYVRGSSFEKPTLEMVQPSQGYVDFGTLRTDETAQRTVVVRNIGGLPVALTPVVENDPTHVFSVVSSNTTPLAPFEEQTFTFHTTPLQEGLYSTVVNITNTENSETVAHVPVTVLAVTPVLGVSPQNIDWGSLVEGWTTSSVPVHIRNTGSGSLRIDAIEWVLGSAQSLRTASLPTFPLWLEGDSPSLDIYVYATAAGRGPMEGVLEITSNAVHNPVSRIPVKLQALTCKEGCPINHAIPACGSGACAIETCETGWHNTDTLLNNGCECREDRLGHDVGNTCSNALQVGKLGDACSSAPSETSRSGTLHSKEDVDIYYAQFDDSSKAGCDVFSDSARTQIDLIQAPPGLVLCARIQPWGSGCGGYSTVFDPAYCGQTRYLRDGSYGPDDSRDATVWVMWHPDAVPSCGEYLIRFRGED